MAKQSITLFSITTTVIVLIIAVVVLLIGNYTKNFNSGITLDHQTISASTNLVNDTEKDAVWVATSATELAGELGKTISGVNWKDNLVVGIIASAQPNAGYTIELMSILLRASRISVNYRLTQPEPDQLYADVITYPPLLLQVSRESLPVGVPIDFAFTNLSSHSTQIVNRTLTL
ncbi:hypothetical protein A2V68_01435 [candidate division Kazan bacterium RBG_13_50_9]|uniref:PrcB C-terminal domain-containing protein n=1 Tax=candidate division Kazan bacterium RBG_13_50_9 TaxID=1798535 RepID=A0A1F4NRB4_UNCK3|nr:MAG: hypothetical protein A2V68_01435 [candidate division Kazan bacterium RBG_13_50_9]